MCCQTIRGDNFHSRRCLGMNLEEIAELQNFMKRKKKGQNIGHFEKLFLKIAIKSFHVGGVGKLDQQN